MNHYQFYLSYTNSDRELANRIEKLLIENGFTVYNPISCLEPVLSYARQLVSAISSCDYFIPIVTDNYSRSDRVLNEIDTARDRKKTILPILVDHPSLSNDALYYLGRAQVTSTTTDEESLKNAISKISQKFGSRLKRDALYEKLSEYQKLRDHNRTALTLSQLIVLASEEMSACENDVPLQIKLLKELYHLYEELSTFSGGYDSETKAIAKEILGNLHKASAPFEMRIFKENFLFALYALHIIYFEYEIAAECVDIRTSGDVHIPFSLESRIKRQAPYLALYEEYCTPKGELKLAYPIKDDEIELLQKAYTHIFAYLNKTPEKASGQHKNEKVAPPFTEDDEIFLSIADFMQKGNELFNLLRGKGIAGDFLKCLLTSYERLKNYCAIVGASRVAAECVERIAEIRQELATHTPSDTTNDKAENGLKSLLGFTVAESGNYDVFISFKSEDNDLAKIVYQFCKQNMIAAFWSKVSLPELSKSDYGDAIDQALDSAKHFVLVLSDLRYLESDWIKYEMSTFADEIREGRKEGSNFIILATEKVYRELIDSNKKCLPIKYRWCQILKLSEFEETLLSYLT